MYLGHRTTRDLDLFWHGAQKLDLQVEEAEQRLKTGGFSVAAVRRFPGFARFEVTDGTESVVLDLVAEPVLWIEPPVTTVIDGVTLHVDTAHEILVNKLCALLGRSEIRDLVDVRALLNAGGDLARALADAPAKDSGFSPLTLTWLLKGLDIAAFAPKEGLTNADTDELAAFRDDLVARLTARSVGP